MYHKILVAVDRSEFRKPVFQAALDIARCNHADMRVLHVMALDEQDNPTIPISTSMGLAGAIDEETMEVYRELWQTYENKGVEVLQSLAALAVGTGVRTEIMQCSGGSPGLEICRLARDWKADLIVLGRRGHSGFSELFLGSVSNYVVHHAPCSVLTVQ
jgi:nucleotide-binding universal stress UspA family protein